MLFHRHQSPRAVLKERDVDGILFTNAANIFYFSGFRGLSPEEREASLLLTPNDVYLFIPRMYREQAQTLDSSVTVVIDEERDGLLFMFPEYLPKKSRLAIEDTNLTMAEYSTMNEVYEGEFVFGSGLAEQLRVVKDEEEIKTITKAVEITDAVFNDVIAHLSTVDYTKLTEFDIAEMLLRMSRERGAEGMSFDSIVASGAGASEPHYRTSGKRLATGEALLMDFGARYKGYNADLTRTVFLGKATPEFRTAYETVLECNKLSNAACKPGIPAGDLHERAVAFFKKRGVEEHFIHGLGHGVGIDVHEEPFFRPGRSMELGPGMMVTIEPGLYYPGKFGIRIEDYVLITKSGATILSDKSPKDLIELP